MLLKDKRVKLGLLALILIVSLLSIKKEELNSSFLLQSLSSDPIYKYHKEILHVEGYAVRFPLRIYYVKGKATINDLEWNMRKLKFSQRHGYSLDLLRSTGTGMERMWLEFTDWHNAQYYYLIVGGAGTHQAIPID